MRHYRADVEKAIHAHSARKVRFRDFLCGKAGLDLTHLGKCEGCKFGLWLEREGRRQLPRSDHDDVHALHAEFHRLAAEIVHMIKQKDFAAAHAELEPDGPFDRASSLLGEHLLKISLT